MTTAEVLRAARAKVDTPEKWWQEGGHNDHLAPDVAGLHCAWLAIYDAGASHCQALAPARTFIKANKVPSGRSVVGRLAVWNDDPSRTHAEVLAAFDRAIELAEAER